MQSTLQVAGGLAQRRDSSWVSVCLARVRRALRRTIAHWKRRRQAAAVYAALRDLNAHTLRDLGFHPIELPSVAAEMAGVADPTRVRVIRAIGNAD